MRLDRTIITIACGASLALIGACADGGSNLTSPRTPGTSSSISAVAAADTFIAQPKLVTAPDTFIVQPRAQATADTFSVKPKLQAALDTFPRHGN